MSVSEDYRRFFRLDPSPVTLRLMKPPERDTLSRRERAVFPNQAAAKAMLSAYQLPRLDQQEVGMVNASLNVASDGDQPPLGIQDFQ